MFGMTNVPAAAAETDAVFSLLAVLADPAKSAQRLAEMKAVLDSIVQQQADLAAKAADFDAAQAAGAAAAAARDADLNVRERTVGDLKAQSAALDQKKADIAAATQVIVDGSAQLDQRTTELNQREAAIAAREARIDARQADLDARDTSLKLGETDYQRRIAGLKALAAS